VGLSGFHPGRQDLSHVHSAHEILRGLVVGVLEIRVGRLIGEVGEQRGHSLTTLFENWPDLSADLGCFLASSAECCSKAHECAH
jgi:hypothetical protein